MTTHCPSGFHTHDEPPGCEYPAKRPGGVCGHRSVRSFISVVGAPVTYRCAAHCGPLAIAAAAAAGYRPRGLTKAEKVVRAAQLERVERGEWAA